MNLRSTLARSLTTDEENANAVVRFDVSINERMPTTSYRRSSAPIRSLYVSLQLPLNASTATPAVTGYRAWVF
jgi:hypothetical protein